MVVYKGEGFNNHTMQKMQSVVDSEFDDTDKTVKPLAGLAQLSNNFLAGTSAHGLPKITASKNIVRKLAWLIIFLGAAAMFSYMMYGAIVQYLNKPVEISISYQVRTEAEFPAVTICNLNALKKSTLAGSDYETLQTIDNSYRDALVSSMGSPGSESSGPGNSGSNSNSASSSRSASVQAELQSQGASDLKLENSDFISNAASDTDFESFMTYSQTDDYSDLTDLLKPSRDHLDMYGHQIQDAILQCSFDKTNCTYLNFTKVYNNRYGNCYVFNINGTRTSLYGSRYGLRLTLNVEPNDYVGLLSHEEGYRIAIHASNVTGFPEDEGVNAASELATSIGVKTSSFSRLPYPYKSNCADGSNHNLMDSGQYTVWSCMSACLQNNLRSQCGCIDTVTLPTGSRCRLTNTTEEVCRQKVYSSYNAGTLGCDCPLPCSEVKYSAKVSTTQWPSSQYIPILWNSIGTDLTALGYTSVGQAKNSLARVHVYLDDLTVHETAEYAAFTEEDLLANMGGYLGLFIGISACTVFEFFEFIIDAFVYLCFTMPSLSCKERMWRKKKGGLLTGNKTLVETVKLPPYPDPIQIKPKKNVLRTQSVTSMDQVGVGFDPGMPTRW